VRMNSSQRQAELTCEQLIDDEDGDRIRAA
jgi:hypothetical protein